MTKNRTRIIAVLLTMLVVICLLPISRLAAADNTDFSFNKNEKPAETYSIDEDSTYVVVKQATSAFLFLRSELTQEQKEDLISKLKSADPSLDKGNGNGNSDNDKEVTWVTITAVSNGIAEYKPNDSEKDNIGWYKVDFNTGTVTIMNQQGERDKSKISHLDYGKYGPTTEPEPTPDPETGTIIIVKNVEGVDEGVTMPLCWYTITGNNTVIENAITEFALFGGVSQCYS